MIKVTPWLTAEWRQASRSVWWSIFRLNKFTIIYTIKICHKFLFKIYNYYHDIERHFKSISIFRCIHSQDNKTVYKFRLKSKIASWTWVLTSLWSQFMLFIKHSAVHFLRFNSLYLHHVSILIFSSQNYFCYLMFYFLQRHK